MGIVTSGRDMPVSGDEGQSAGKNENGDGERAGMAHALSVINRQF